MQVIKHSLFHKLLFSILLFSIIMLAFILRVNALNHESLSYDEVVAIQIAKLPIHELFSAIRLDNNPPLYYLFLQEWMKVFGESEFSVRFPSVLFSTVTLVFLYLVSRQFFSKYVSLIPVLFTCLSAINIYYGKIARSYSLMGLLSVCSLFYFNRLLKTHNKKNILLYIFTTILLLYTHLYGIFILLAQNVYILITFSQKQKRKILKPWLLYQCVIAICFLPWIQLVLIQIQAIHSHFWIPRPTILSLVSTFISYTGSLFVFILLLTILFTNLIHYINSLKTKKTDKKEKSNKLLLLILWCLLPVAIPFTISQVTTPIYYYRYTISSSFAFFLLFTWSFVQIKNYYLKAILLITVILSMSFIINRPYFSQNVDWHAIAIYMKKNVRPTDAIVIEPPRMQVPLQYYLRDKQADIVTLPLKNFSYNETFDTLYIDRTDYSLLPKTLSNYNRVWLVIDKNATSLPTITSQLHKHFHQLDEEQFYEIKIITYEE